MASPAGKRGRDPDEEEMCLDNFHSHKRYLSEIMASSLNGLSVGDSLTENLVESPLSDEGAAPYSPMSEDSYDPRFTCDHSPLSSPVPFDVPSRPTSPGSPHRHQKILSSLLYSSINPYPLPGCTLPSVVVSHPRQRRSDSDGRFPSSPSDMCHTADLRKAALLRSVQMRTQPTCSAVDSGQGNVQSLDERDNQRSCECLKTDQDEGVGYQCIDQVSHFDEGFRDDAGHLQQGEKCFEKNE